MMWPTEMQARLDGQMAALRKSAASDNPHAFGSSVSRAWAKGFREIMGDIQVRPSRGRP